MSPNQRHEHCWAEVATRTTVTAVAEPARPPLFAVEATPETCVVFFSLGMQSLELRTSVYGRNTMWCHRALFCAVTLPSQDSTVGTYGDYN